MKSNFIFKKGLFFSLGLFLFLGASCNNRASTSISSTSISSTNGTIPTYQGMTVSSVNTPLQGIQYANDVNQENPFEDNQQNKIETRINTFLGNNTINEEFAYFARANETVRVTINILNPDSYVILSFNLNGRRYQSFEFREGSNSTRLLMDVILSPNVGLQELTLDEIKYIDGTEIKDAILFGEKTVRVGVLYPNLPEVSVTEKTIGKTSLELDIRVTDVNGLIANAPKPLYAFFYDGKTLKQQELTIGQNTIVFDKLKSQTVYQYAIATIFDRLDGSGNAVRLFTKEAISTNKFLAMSLSTTKTSLSFDVTVEDSDSIGEITKVSLLKNNTIVQEILGQTEGTFSNLFTNNTYIVKAQFSYQFDEAGEVFEETEEQTGVTVANLTPTFAFSDVNPGQEDIVFEYTVTDTDAVGSLTKIELLKGTTVVETLTEYESTMFEGLLSNNDYQIKATYTYDLNDGTGVKTAVVTSNTKTLAKATPTFTFSDVVPDQEDIVFEYTVTDTDAVGSLTKIELLKGTTVVETLTDFDATTFEGLLSNNDYQIKATYTYDLNDGAGIKTAVVTSNTKTLAKATPTYTIFDTSSTSSSVSFDIDVLDSNGIGDITKIELYRDTTLIDSFDLINEEWPNLFLFEELISNTEHTIQLTYTYDLNEGNGIIEMEKVFLIMTLPKTNIVSIQITEAKLNVDEEFLLYIYLNREDKGIVNSLTINNSVYNNFEIGSTASKFIIKHKGFNESGVKSLVINSVQINNRSFLQSVDFSIGNILNIVVFDEIHLIDIYFENNKDLIVVNNDIELNISFENLNLYEIDNITLNNKVFTSEDFTVLDNVITIDINVANLGNNVFILNQLNYSIGNNDYIKKFTSENYISIFGYDGSTTEIHTVSQLQNMEPNKVYYVMNDLDFSEIIWQAYSFRGYLEGNGHTIQNINYLNLNNSKQTHSIFQDLNKSVIKNLKLNVLFDITNNKDTSNLTIGVLALNSYETVIQNVNVSGSITAQSNNLYVGGVVFNNVGYIYNSTIDLTINTTSKHTGYNYMVVGGISAINNGVISFSNVTTTINSISIGYSDSNVGGVSGINYNLIYNINSEAYLNNVTDYSYTYTGGITGYNKENSTIYNVSVIGTLYARGYSSVGGVIGWNSGVLNKAFAKVSVSFDTYGGSLIGRNREGILTNSISVSSTGLYGDNYLSETKNLYFNEEIIWQTDWFIDTLSWNEDDWELIIVDVENNIYPSVKTLN
jgi:hypothetical protein